MTEASLNLSEYEEPISNPCIPSPCGPNSYCHVTENRAVCRCQADYFGSPPRCRQECMINSDCSRDRACRRNKCSNPCLGACGVNAVCQVINHSPICTCSSGYTGDPFESCRITRKNCSHRFLVIRETNGRCSRAR